MRGRIRLMAGGVVVGLGVAAVAVTGAPALAAAGGSGHTVTMTEHQHGTFQEPDATNPCTGAPGVATFDGNAVEHVTYFPDSDEVWATFTETGKVTLIDSNGVTYTGHITAWGNFNMNEQNSNNSFTLTVMLAGSDGSSITVHEVQHFALNANGVVTVNFDRPTLSCG